MSNGEEPVKGFAASDEIVDVSGDPVSEVMQRWLLFIALHLESDNEFSDDALVDDVLLALGFQDKDERERRSAPGSPYLVRFGDRLQELKDTWLVDRSVDGDSGVVRFQVAAEIDRIDQAIEALGGSIWADGDADRLDTEPELAWLLIIALRMHSGRIAHDDLLKRFNSLLGRDDSYHEPISLVIQDLERHGLIQFNEGVKIGPLRLLDGYRVVDDEHVGLDQLWRRLYEEFGGQPLFAHEASPVMDESVTDESAAPPDGQQVHADAPANSPDASASAETPVATRDAEPPEVDEQRDAPGPDPLPVPVRSSVAQMDLPRSVRLQPLDDVDLCMAVLQTLAKAFDRSSPSLDDIKKELINEAAVPVEYDAEPPPPWIRNLRVSGDPKKERFRSLLEFRLDHTLRAMSLHRTGLIRSVEIVSEDQHWSLTGDGLDLIRQPDSDGKQQLGKKVESYFNIHNYSSVHDYDSWRETGWVTAFMEKLVALGPDGVFFEQLCFELLRKIHPYSKVEQSTPNGWLDSNAVDHLVTTPQNAEDEQKAMNKPEAEQLLVQCKRWDRVEIDAGQIAKLFASAARFRAQAYNNMKLNDIEGARFIYLGSLSHDASWVYWALKDAWEKLDEPASTSGEVENSQPTLRWELWDGTKLFALIKEHELGVNIDRHSDTVTIDENFFDQLRKDAEFRKLLKG